MSRQNYTLDILILAGGPLSEVIEGQPPVHRSLMEVHGKSVLEHMIDAVRQSGICNQLIVIGSEMVTASSIPSKADTYIAVEASSKLSENFRKGTAKSEASHILIIGGDIPTLHADILVQLNQLVLEHKEKDLLAFVVLKEAVEQSFPGSQRTYGKIKEGRAKVGNSILVRRDALSRLDPLIDKFTKNRKSVLKLAFSFGILNIIRLALLKNISIPQLEKAFKKSTHLDVKGIIVPFGELAVDIDKASDIASIENYFRRNE